MEKDVTRHIEEQLSAFLDGELPQEELDLLVRRLERDETYRATLDRYALIGGALRNDIAADSAGLRRGIMAELENEGGTGSEAVSQSEVTGGGQLRYLLAASLVVGVVAVFTGMNFDRSALSGGGLTAPQTAAVAQSAPVGSGPAVVSTTDTAGRISEDPARLRHQRELQRVRLNQERMRSYLISHGEHSRSLQGAMTDSRMYVQQASFSE